VNATPTLHELDRRPVTEYRIEAGQYTATITADGGALRELRYGHRDLIVPFAAGEPIPDYRGIIAAPWPNRIADGRYTIDGNTFQVPINETQRSCALHGLVFPLQWSLVSQEANAVRLACTLESTPGYPHNLHLDIEYRLTNDGLHSRVTAVNTGHTTAPYGVCPHPYLVAGPAPLDEWTLEIPASTFLEVSEDRLLPKNSRVVEDHEFDFRAARPIGGIEIDHAFTDISFDDRGRARVVIHDPGGTGVGMEWDRRCSWLQIHTADKQPPLPNRLGLAVEPMTCPPDAFNSGQDLILLEPGASWKVAWKIYSIQPR
jgi:aldose 1-epimerase